MRKRGASTALRSPALRSPSARRDLASAPAAVPRARSGSRAAARGRPRLCRTPAGRAGSTAAGTKLCAALLVASALAGCWDGARTYEARGVVREVQRDYGQVIVAHEEIPGLMSAMTMNFEVADPALYEVLEAGQEIAFTLEVSQKGYRITEARVLGHGEGGGGPQLALAEEAAPAPSFELTDQDGEPLALRDLRGRAVVLDFIFTSCPGPCPILTARQVALQRRLDPEVRERTHFVSVSLDPRRDTPEALREYASEHGADLSDWSFLTGPEEKIDAVLSQYGVGRTRGDDGSIDHRIATFLIDPQGRIARRYVGLDHEPEAMERDLRRALR